MRSILTVRPSYMPKYVPTAGDGCVLWLPGQDDPQSLVIRDRSGKGNHGTITGASWTRLGSGLWVNSFDGTDDKIAIPATSSMRIVGDQMSAVFWANWISVTIDKGIIGRDSTAGVGLEVLTGGVDGRLQIRTTTSNPAVYTSEDAIPTVNTWYCYGVVYNGTDVRIYVNTVLQADIDAQTGNLTDTASAYWLGSYYSADYSANVKLGLVRMFNRALSTTEIAGIYQSERHLLGV